MTEDKQVFLNLFSKQYFQYFRNSYMKWFNFKKKECKQCVAFICEMSKLEINTAKGDYTAHAEFGGAVIKIFAASMVEWFKHNGGINYVTCNLSDSNTKEKYSITMQKVDGKTPSEEIGNLKEEISNLKRQLNTALQNQCKCP